MAEHMMQNGADESDVGKGQGGTRDDEFFVSVINRTMWSNQESFRRDVLHLFGSAMTKLGINKEGTECLLVGVTVPDHSTPNQVFVEPLDRKTPTDLFDGILDRIEEEEANHPLRDRRHGDDARILGPGFIRCDAIRRAVLKALRSQDLASGVHSFVGAAVPVHNYLVVPVLQLPVKLLERVPSLRVPVSDDGTDSCSPSLLHATITEVLKASRSALLEPSPGILQPTARWPSPEETVNRAAGTFMYTLQVVAQGHMLWISDLFKECNRIASWRYEGKTGKGTFLLSDPIGGAINMTLTFSRPVPFREPRWSHKVLQMASSESCLIFNGEQILGLGKVADGIDPWESQAVFAIEFMDYYHWRLVCGTKVLLVSRHGVPSLPQEEITCDQLHVCYERLFGEAKESGFDQFFKLYETAVHQQHGSLLVVAQDAESEADRLQSQGTRIEPRKLSPDLSGCGKTRPARI